jgi:uncharacterized protein
MRKLALASLGLLLAAPLLSQGAPDYSAQRAARFARLTQPYGWFSLVALGWLRPGVTTVGSAPGSQVVLPNTPAHLMRVTVGANGAAELLEADPKLQLHGNPAPLHTPLPQDEEDSSALTLGDLRMWVIDRNGKKYLRVKSPEAPARVHAHPLSWYAPDARFRVEAKWVPYTTPHTMRVLNELGQVSTEPVPGYAEFTVGGQPERLQPMVEGDKLFFVFRDGTAGSTTYGAGRFLTTDPPAGGMKQAGTIVLDFNQAVNPPCAYSPFATCPVASPENRMKVAIPAGEKRYE